MKKIIILVMAVILAGAGIFWITNPAQSAQHTQNDVQLLARCVNGDDRRDGGYIVWMVDEEKV